ncbi:MAG: hypothetical protein AB7U85_03260 [Alphaproteobacteria bacterium]
MKNHIIPDINNIIKIIGFCFLSMLVVINIPHFAPQATLAGILLFFIFITPAFILLKRKYLKALETSFEKNLDIPTPLIKNIIAANFLKLQLKTSSEFKIIKTLEIFERLKSPLNENIINELAKKPNILPYLAKTMASCPETSEIALNYLDEEDLKTKAAAIEAFLTYGNDNQIDLASVHLKKLLNTDDSSLKIIGINIIGKTKRTEFLDQLVTLFDDDDIHVKRTALITAGKCGDDSFYPHILTSIKNNKLFYAACKAMRYFAPKMSLENLNEVLQNIPEKQRITFLKNISASKSENVILFLVKTLNQTKFLTKKKIVDCLYDMDFKADDKTSPIIKICLYNSAEHASWLLSAINDISTNLEIADLKRVLKYEFDLTKEMVFKLLPILLPHTKNLITLASDAKLGLPFYSTKELEKALPDEIKLICMPLIEHLSLKEKALRLKPYFSQTSVRFEDRLIQIFSADYNKNLELSRAYALFIAFKMKNHIFFEYFEKAVSDKSKLVSKTAKWIIVEIASNSTL